MQNYFDVLKDTPLFKGLARSEINALLRCLEALKHRFDRGGHVIMENGPITHLGIVMRRRIQINKTDIDGSRLMLMKKPEYKNSGREQLNLRQNHDLEEKYS